METAHFQHHVTGRIVLHFGSRCRFYGNVGVWDIGKVWTDGIDDFVRAAMPALPIRIVLLFPVFQESYTHGGLVYCCKAVGATDVHAVVHDFRNIPDTGFDNACDTVCRFDVRTYRHFELDGYHTLILSRRDFDSQEILGQNADKEKRCAKGDNLEKNTRNRKAESKELQINEADSVQNLRENSQSACYNARL